MNLSRTLTFAIMDPPFESARTVTAFRLIQSALDAGCNVNVFAYEGAVSLAFTRQAAHPNAQHGRDADEEDHPLPRVWIEKLFELAARRGVTIEWVNCGLCNDERGVTEAVEGVRRGSPADFWRMSMSSHNTVVIATR